MKYCFHQMINVFLIIFLMPLFANAKVIPHYSMQEYDIEIEQLYKNPKMQNHDLSARIMLSSGYFLGKRYLNGALGEGFAAEFDQNPLYRTDAFDCTTYVSTVLALVEGINLQQFKNNIKKINYQNKQINYVNRNHFIELDWNSHNQQNGYLIDITNKIGKHVAENATIVIDKPAWYRMKSITTIKSINSLSAFQEQTLLKKLHALSSLVRSETATITYLPLQKLFNLDGTPNKSLFDQIPNGSVVEIIGPSWSLKSAIGTDLLVSHMGFAIRDSRGLMFREASSDLRSIVDLPLVEYLRCYLSGPQRVKGIQVQKIIYKG